MPMPSSETTPVYSHRSGLKVNDYPGLFQSLPRIWSTRIDSRNSFGFSSHLAITWKRMA